MKKFLELLTHLLPAAVVIAMIGGFAVSPELAAIPDLLAPAAAQEQEETEASGFQLTEPVEAEAEELVQGVGTYTDGTFTGSANGYGGKVTVQVTVVGGQITDIQVLSHSGETEPFYSRATGVISKMLTAQTWEVDAVSGATYSSNGIKGAVQNALTGETVATELGSANQPTGNAAALTTVSYTAPEGGYKDGIYTGSAQGFGGTVTVQVTITDGAIADVSLVSASGETSSYLSMASSVLSSIVSAQSPNVDAVSGATYSSTGIINAAKNALKKAAADGEETPEETPEETEPAETEAIPPVIEFTSVPNRGYTDGVYTGTGEGFGGDVTLTLTVSGGQITAVNVDSAEDETPLYWNRASVLLSTILQEQTWEVDAVSGATFSSEGILEAAENALSQAIKQPEQSEESEELDILVMPAWIIPNYPEKPAAEPEKEKEPPVIKPTGVKPAETEQPTETEPAETKPAETEPVETEPVESEPVETEPVETEPVETEQPFEPTTETTTQEYTYSGSATVEPDDNEDFEAYNLTLTVTVTETTTVYTEKDQVTTTVTRTITGAEYSIDSADKSNSRYSSKAWDGMNAGLLADGTADAVSRATCSSNAIRTAWKQAAAQAAAGTTTTVEPRTPESGLPAVNEEVRE